MAKLVDATDLIGLSLGMVLVPLFGGSGSIIHSMEALVGYAPDKSQNMIGIADPKLWNLGVGPEMATCGELKRIPSEFALQECIKATCPPQTDDSSYSDLSSVFKNWDMMMVNGFSTNYYGGLTENLVFSQIPNHNRPKIASTTTDPQFSICVGSSISTWENNYKAKSSKDTEARRGTSGSLPNDQSDDDFDLEGLCEQSPQSPTEPVAIYRNISEFHPCGQG
ncbi:hypothetical protein Ddye_022406 [Dipteronia dyeriana]|uniref:Uncharacterized protein n=1 Tax=Dipteronia dyeriana TaxID=168575 RepID=A0AAD9U453_9ROSI|nr:hypothetical protein Ddye_022406 [Dipteronia dyeriana]